MNVTSSGDFQSARLKPGKGDFCTVALWEVVQRSKYHIRYFQSCSLSSKTNHKPYVNKSFLAFTVRVDGACVLLRWRLQGDLPLMKANRSICKRYANESLGLISAIHFMGVCSVVSKSLMSLMLGSSTVTKGGGWKSTNQWLNSFADRDPVMDQSGQSNQGPMNLHKAVLNCWNLKINVLQNYLKTFFNYI